ncbi:hypothetical protein, partial [Mariniphaga sediminis]|uniref:hypothetical protein n=1 Tax=Mariniphaga sediminis TaxID=1628158 RepID=UPI003569CBDD
YEGKELSSPELRKEFDRDFVLQTDWYKERLRLKQQKDTAFLNKQIRYLKDFMSDPNNQELVEKMEISGRLQSAFNNLQHVESDQYLDELVGTIGADPLFRGK